MGDPAPLDLERLKSTALEQPTVVSGFLHYLEHLSIDGTQCHHVTEGDASGSRVLVVVGYSSWETVKEWCPSPARLQQLAS